MQIVNQRGNIRIFSSRLVVDIMQLILPVIHHSLLSKNIGEFLSYNAMKTILILLNIYVINLLNTFKKIYLRKVRLRQAQPYLIQNKLKHHSLVGLT